MQTLLNYDYQTNQIDTHDFINQINYLNPSNLNFRAKKISTENAEKNRLNPTIFGLKIQKAVNWDFLRIIFKHCVKVIKMGFPCFSLWSWSGTIESHAASPKMQLFFRHFPHIWCKSNSLTMKVAWKLKKHKKYTLLFFSFVA